MAVAAGELAPEQLDALVDGVLRDTARPL